MNKWWHSFDPGDRQTLASIFLGAFVSLSVWWVIQGRRKYGAKGLR